MVKLSGTSSSWSSLQSGGVGTRGNRLPRLSLREELGPGRAARVADDPGAKEFGGGNAVTG